MHGKLRKHYKILIKSNQKHITRHTLINYANQIQQASRRRYRNLRAASSIYNEDKRRKTHWQKKVLSLKRLYKRRSNFALQTEHQPEHLFRVKHRLQRKRNISKYLDESNNIIHVQGKNLTYQLVLSKTEQVYEVMPLRSVQGNAPKPPSLHSFCVLSDD